ncbi:hypothetical protein, partial [Brevundimonas sp. SL161]
MITTAPTAALGLKAAAAAVPIVEKPLLDDALPGCPQGLPRASSTPKKAMAGELRIRSIIRVRSLSVTQPSAWATMAQPATTAS